MNPWWMPVPRFRKTKNLPSILQICPSYRRACGIGQFAYNLQKSLKSLGFDMRTTSRLRHSKEDIILIQHEYSLFPTKELKDFLAECKQERVLFAHTAVGSEFNDDFDAFVCMCKGMVRTRKPVCLFPLPGFYNEDAAASPLLRKKYGFDKYNCVLGTNGFINLNRDILELATILTILGKKYNWAVNLVMSKHGSHKKFPEYVALEKKLLTLRDSYDNLYLNTEFLPQREVYKRLSMCDLLWCWSNVDGKYASATASDQYCTGSHLVATRKAQHSAVFGLPGVTLAPTNLPGFTEALVNKALSGEYPRHDGSILSWERCIPILANFLKKLRGR